MFWKPGASRPTNFSSDSVKDSSVSLPSFDQDDKASLSVIYNSKRHLPLQQQRRQLPIYSHCKEFLWAVQSSRVVLVTGEPGCGKSTQLPQYLKEAGWCNNGTDIIICVPMRIAAVTLATRVAEEIGTSLGNQVGFCTGDETCLNKQTSIRYVTDGVLMRMIQADPLLLKTSVVILDDCHQRRTETDILLGLLKKIQRKRRYLRLIISSATVDTEMFVNFFHTHWMTSKETQSFEDNQSTHQLSTSHFSTRWDSESSTPTATHEDLRPLQDVSILRITGRSFPITIKHLTAPCYDYIKAAFETVLHIHETQRDMGTVLVFLCGKDDIETLVERLNNTTEFDERRGQIQASPLYGALPPDQQLEAFRRPRQNHRKVVVATNIAESSVTIDNVFYVVDCGFVKTSFFDYHHSIQFLSVVPISKAAAIQRAGRAGRIGPGVCYRLYPELSINQLMPEFSTPELLRTNLSQTILYFLSLGIDNIVSQIELPTPISSESVISALSELYSLEAINEFGQLTKPLGCRMAELPLDPKLARFLLLSTEEKYSCSYEAIIISAMATCGSPWVVPPSKSRLKQGILEACMRSLGVVEGDFVTLYNVYKQSEFYKGEDSNWDSRHMISTKALKRVEKVKRQLESYFKLWGLNTVSCGNDLSTLCKTICAGFFLTACRRQRNGTYTLCRQPSGTQPDYIPPLIIHPMSLANPKQPLFLVYQEAIAVAGLSGGEGDKHSSTGLRDVTHLLGVTPIDPKWLPEVAGHYYKLNLQHDT